MVRRGAGRITAQDITRMGGEGGVPTVVAMLVKTATTGDQETKESAAVALCSLAGQNHFEHCQVVYEAGAVVPLVSILATGTSKAQGAADVKAAMARDGADPRNLGPDEFPAFFRQEVEKYAKLVKLAGAKAE